MIDFSCDYNCGCAPEILAALTAANESQHATYGLDAISARAKDKIRAAVGNPDADVFFLVGGTQTNATVLSSILRPWEGVVSAASGHIAVHESGAVEATGHKVLPVEADACGRIEPETLRNYLRGFYADETHPHMVQPGAVYLSHPTEYGGLYSAAALREIRATCDEYGLSLFVDGARLAYALASPETDVTLPLLGKVCDVFYIGGTKCGALLGEAVVFRRSQKHFFTAHKQRGALLAKGFLLGLQFDTLFSDDLYLRLGRQGTECALALREGLRAMGVAFRPESGSNQQFPVLSSEQLQKLDGKIGYEIWQRLPDGSAVIRLCASWRTTMADVDAVLDVLRA
ncbi:MAG: low specificity L-threonine aldolase [Oscillospiraceae bacterium]|nr:low specificity L-threonine aldolase [Oscillospiraceae bacterium]